MEKKSKMNETVVLLKATNFVNQLLTEKRTGVAAKTIFIFSLIIISFINSSQGQDTLQNYIERAAEANPALISAFREYQAALERVPQVGALPDPELSVGFFLRPFPRYMGNQYLDARLMQMFPWFGTLGTRRDQATLLARARFEEFQSRKNETVYEVKINWYKLYALHKRIVFVERQLAILQSLESLATTRFETGTASLADILRVQIEIEQVEARLALLKDDLRPLEAEFNRLLNRNAEESIFIPDTLITKVPDINWRELQDSVIANNPELLAISQEREAADVGRRLAVQEGRPAFGVGVNYMYFADREGMDVSGRNHMFMPMLTTTLPIYRGRYKALRKESELMYQSINEQIQDEEKRLGVELEVVRRNLFDAQRRINLHQSLILKARQAREVLITQYSTAGEDFEEVLRLQDQILEYQISLLEAVVEQEIALARLERVAATDIY